MADSSKQQETAVGTSSASETKDASKAAPTSPARSDKSSDSEGKPVRDKLKETRIDAQSTSDPTTTSDQPMDEAVNGSEKVGENSTSGSDSDRGRLRRKRSREDFEDEQEADKQPDKKHEKNERHHVRKRSRDVKDIESGMPLKPPKASVSRIEENDGDEQMTTPSKDTSKAAAAATATPKTDTSPKNKRTRDQVEEDPAATTDSAKEPTANGKPVAKAEDEREAKRPRDKEEVKATVTTAKACSFLVMYQHSSNDVLDTPRKRFCKYFCCISLCRHVPQAAGVQID
jgi:Ran-binding protein 3